MKKIFLTISILLVLCISCTKDGADLLDPAGSSGLDEAAVFGNAQNSERFLLEIYRVILPVLPRTDGAGSRWRNSSLLEVATENGSSALQGGDVNYRRFAKGTFTPSETNMSWYLDWQDSYSSIRALNLFLSKIDNVPLDPATSYDAATRTIRKAEAKWLLAFNYAELVKQFGGVPILEKILTPEEAAAGGIKRNTFDETIANIVRLCDEAAADLPVVHIISQLGRATKGAALALKARTLLYAASPLWNDPARATDSPFSGQYDATNAKWVKAAQAAQAVIALNTYQLHADISTLFNTRTNTEIIFARMQEPMSYFHATNVPFTLFDGTGAYGVAGNNQVTYNMIKQYEVLRGGLAYAIDDPAALYNPQDPYKNLDPRFYRDCIYNGGKLKFGSNPVKTAQFGEIVGNRPAPLHNTPPFGSLTNTFVYNVKFADLTLNVTWDARNPGAGTRTNQNYPYLRYAEVLLNYAEAMNEAYGPEATGPGLTMTALQAVNEVRTRAKYPAGKTEYLGYTGGMPPFASGLSQAQFRTKLQHERRVEFCYEEHWFWDFRRWKLTPETDIKAQVPVWKVDNSVEYQIRTIESRYFNERMYRMPIPQVDLQLNPLLVQNPGW
jgi:hypothetical protein